MGSPTQGPQEGIGTSTNEPTLEEIRQALGIKPEDDVATFTSIFDAKQVGNGVLTPTVECSRDRLPVPCIVCNKTLQPVLESAGNNPNGATCFVAFGNYGSGLYDPSGDTRDVLEINVCDDCLRYASKRMRVLYVEHGTTYEPGEDYFVAFSS